MEKIKNMKEYTEIMRRIDEQEIKVEKCEKRIKMEEERLDKAEKNIAEKRNDLAKMGLSYAVFDYCNSSYQKADLQIEESRKQYVLLKKELEDNKTLIKNSRITFTKQMLFKIKLRKMVALLPASMFGITAYSTVRGISNLKIYGADFLLLSITLTGLSLYLSNLYFENNKSFMDKEKELKINLKKYKLADNKK